MLPIAEPFLHAQIDLYAAQSEAAEVGFAGSQRVDFGDIEDAIALGLATFAGLRRHSQSWAVETATGKANFSWDVSRRFTEEHRRWKEKTAGLLKVIDHCKTHGGILAGERELRDAFKDVSLMPLDTDRMRAAYESLLAGQGISHSEAMDELRYRLAPGRA